MTLTSTSSSSGEIFIPTSSFYSSISSTTNTTPESPSAILATVRSSLRCSQDYAFSELLRATNQFLARPLSGNSTTWHCVLRGMDAAIVRCPFSLSFPELLPVRLAALCRSNHSCIAKIHGACLSNNHIYLVYDFIHGSTLANCLKNPNNPNFTPLSTWLSRVQIAADIAQGLEYIHHYAISGRGAIHGRIKTTSIIITDTLRAKILNFGLAELAGNKANDGTRIEMARGYMAPELINGGKPTKKSDVYAFGVVLLELMSGKEAVRYEYNEGEVRKWSVVEDAKSAEGEGRVREWMDWKVRDSWPEGAAEKAMRVALRCVESEEGMRPEMVWVAGKMSKVLVEAKEWEEKVRRRGMDISVSLAPR